MKYPLFLLLFCLACTAAKIPTEPKPEKIARLNGSYMPYDVAIKRSAPYWPANMDSLGRGNIYAIGGHMVRDTTTYIFYRRRQ